MNIYEKQKAKYFYLCIEIGLDIHSEIIIWVDKLIENGISDIDIIDLSLSSNNKDTKRILGRLSQNADSEGIKETIIINSINLFQNNFKAINSIFMQFWSDEFTNDALMNNLYTFEHYINDGCLEDGSISMDDVALVLEEVIRICKRKCVNALLI